MDVANQEELNQYFEIALNIVRKAGEVVNNAIKSRDKKRKNLKQYIIIKGRSQKISQVPKLKTFITSVDLKSTATDLVTETDKAVEKLIVDGLKSNFPNHKFIGEEGTAELGGDTFNEFTNDPTWIIDPIDGTMNFVHR